MSKLIALTSFDKEDNLVIEIFKYNFFKTKLKAIGKPTIILKSMLKEYYKNK